MSYPPVYVPRHLRQPAKQRVDDGRKLRVGDTDDGRAARKTGAINTQRRQRKKMAKTDASETGMDGSARSSSQLLASGAALTTQLEGGGASQGADSTDPSVEVDVSNDGSYFILDGGGQHVLDDQGSPARARKWQPVNAQQRERYM